MWVTQEKQGAACSSAWVLAAPRRVCVVRGELAAGGVQ